jgi:PIN domain nuclease of toxin-antitoxin system
LRLLVDTHVFLWFTSDPQELAENAFLAIEDPDNDVFISAAVAWEISIKYAKGKLSLPLEPAVYVPTRLKELGFAPLAITLEHALAAASLPSIHANPFDRIMVAQAQTESLTFVTRDAHLLRYPVKAIPA